MQATARLNVSHIEVGGHKVTGLDSITAFAGSAIEY